MNDEQRSVGPLEQVHERLFPGKTDREVTANDRELVIMVTKRLLGWQAELWNRLIVYTPPVTPESKFVAVIIEDRISSQLFSATVPIDMLFDDDPGPFHDALQELKETAYRQFTLADKVPCL